MVTAYYGGRAGTALELDYSDEFVAVRTLRRSPLERTPLSRGARAVIADLAPVTRFSSAGVDVLHTGSGRDARRKRDRARTVLKKEPEIRFAGRVLAESTAQQPVVYTENIFVKFHDDVPRRTCLAAIGRHELTVKSEPGFARNAFFLGAPEGIGIKVFAIAERLLAQGEVQVCQPELVREIRRRAVFPMQWHLKKQKINGVTIDAGIDVESAWNYAKGSGITIAIIDDGVDIDHEEFASAGKIVSPWNATARNNNPRPGSGANHGTACAGVACADGARGASGVAPKAKLMPIRMVSGLGSQAEADAFFWAAQNGADVISCSWGPADGEWWNSKDPLHRQTVHLPDSTRLAIDYAVEHGRNGKGCVICWAAGNGNESVDRDGYASYKKVMAIAACNDRSVKSAYSDHGKAVWCTFPSSETDGTGLTPGIWTTDRSGADGYNPGDTHKGDAAGNYANDFGGTSSASPGAAGVAALILSRRPSLKWDAVRDIIKKSAVKIDSKGGRYNAAGHSPKYGYGRVNAQKAIARVDTEISIEKQRRLRELAAQSKKGRK
jgi:subtilisin family serine protease